MTVSFINYNEVKVIRRFTKINHTQEHHGRSQMVKAITSQLMQTCKFNCKWALKHITAKVFHFFHWSHRLKVLPQTRVISEAKVLNTSASHLESWETYKETAGNSQYKYGHINEPKKCYCADVTSLLRGAQHVCLTFQTTAATSSRDRKQLETRHMENQ